MTGSTPVAQHAESTATMIPGKDPLAPTATLSPASSPSSWKYLTVSAAKSGLVAVRFASRFPGVVVISVSSSPMSPVTLRSSGLRGIPTDSLWAFTASDASSIFRAARSMTSYSSCLPIYDVEKVNCSANVTTARDATARSTLPLLDLSFTLATTIVIISHPTSTSRVRTSVSTRDGRSRPPPRRTARS